MSRRGRRGAGAASPAGAALLSCLLSLACASSPDPRASPAPLPEAGAGEAQAAGPGTALKTAEAAELSKARDERGAIEAAIAFGSPSSLERALELLRASTLLKPEDAAAYLRIAEGVYDIAYREASPSAGAGAAPDGAQPGAAPAASPALAGVLFLLAEARAGRVQAPPPEAAGTPLGELLPALALFSSESRDTARRAAEAIDRFARLALPSVLPDLALGAEAERRRDYPGARERYAAALALAPDAVSASLGSARALLALGRAEEALALLEPLAGRLGGSLAFDRAWASALAENGRFLEAGPIVARVLTADPQDSALMLVRARLLVRGNSFQQALPLLDAYGTVDPSNRGFLILRSRVAEGLKSREEALRWARRGLASYPEDPELLMAAARALYAGSEAGKDEARILARKAAEPLGSAEPGPSGQAEPLGPADRADRAAARAEAARLLAADAAARYDWQAASAYYAAASKAGPFEDRRLAAAILRESGQLPAALDYAAAWFKQSPGSEEAGLAYARALVASGEGRAAQDLIARLLPASRSGSFRSALFFLQSGLQKGDEAALPLLRSALMEDADNPEALAALSDIHLRRKDLAKARFYLKQALALSPRDPALLRRQAELDKAGQ
ncbi:MAG TPA: tetratricopeptide repeat protein [Spirochaetales bacterium]|nr:tetratricopeptide repeat protein [Spirochaetales bacterium]